MFVKKIILLIFIIVLIINGCTAVNTHLYGPNQSFAGKSSDDNVYINIPAGIYGKCILIRFPNDEAIIADCGTSEDFPVIYQYLRNLGIERIKYIILTSSQEESVGGLYKMLSNFKVSAVYYGEKTGDTSFYTDIQDRALELGTNAYAISAGTRLYDMDKCSIDAVINERYADDKEINALCLYIVHGYKTLFIDGGVDKQTEARLANELKGLIKSDVLISSGKKSDRSEYFAREISPLYHVMYSVYGEMPAGNVYDVYSSSEIISTSANGEIVIESNGTDVIISYER